MMNRSMETTDASLWRNECSRSVQTNFQDDENLIAKNESEADGLTKKRRRFSNLKNIPSFEHVHLTDTRCEYFNFAHF